MSYLQRPQPTHVLQPVRSSERSVSIASLLAARSVLSLLTEEEQDARAWLSAPDAASKRERRHEFFSLAALLRGGAGDGAPPSLSDRALANLRKAIELADAHGAEFEPDVQHQVTKIIDVLLVRSGRPLSSGADAPEWIEAVLGAMRVIVVSAAIFDNRWVVWYKELSRGCVEDARDAAALAPRRLEFADAAAFAERVRLGDDGRPTMIVGLGSHHRDAFRNRNSLKKTSAGLAAAERFVAVAGAYSYDVAAATQLLMAGKSPVQLARAPPLRLFADGREPIDFVASAKARSARHLSPPKISLPPALRPINTRLRNR